MRLFRCYRETYRKKANSTTHAGCGRLNSVETPPILSPTAATSKAPRQRRKKWIIIGIALTVICIGAGSFFALRKKDPAIYVQTEKVSRHSITETVVANGRIFPVLQVRISAEVSGEIIELRVKEGQSVRKGDVLLKIKPDFYVAALNQAKANFQSSLAAKSTSTANLERAEAEFKRNRELFERKLISDSEYIAFKASRDVAVASAQSASNQIEVARATVASAEESLAKTTILAPIDGTVSKLNSQVGERVLGTVQNAGTDIMVISDLSRMEARVDIGEMDIVLLQPGQNARLEVDSFKDKKFAGMVTDVANSSKDMNVASGFGGMGGSSSSSGQSATQFQVRIRFTEPDTFRPGMSVSATIETRTRTNVIAAPIAAITTRIVKDKSSTTKTNDPVNNAILTNAATHSAANSSASVKKNPDRNKPTEVVFVVKGSQVRTVPVKIGISDDTHWEITEGLQEGDEIVTGGFKAVSRDLDDGKKISKDNKAK